MAFQLKASGPSYDSLPSFWSQKSVVGEAFHMPNLQEGDMGEHYPFLWRVMKLDDYQFVLRKGMADCGSTGVYAQLPELSRFSQAAWLTSSIRSAPRPLRTGVDIFPATYYMLAGIHAGGDMLLQSDDLKSVCDGDSEYLL